ncbi:glycoside hydrolase [Flavobacterium cheongpyeongense]|uniref:Glycoside hydrolase n=1 Tax=Flavobacterium cheongpyeongense TaxID=2212651 RepID=A0A2V4BKI3_9FLAO|nr:glycoside hydrolase 43 family protein [Flavobacterium cheongpyeongense]PXY39237.1 glycoside hydrolase [Flavobacterium cheongpyeongense]
MIYRKSYFKFILIIHLLMLFGCKSGVEKQSVNNETTHLSKNYISKVWQSDLGDGTYTNPILYADYSDPDVIRVENNYYMTASSFNCVPGLPILYSKDLVNWEIISYALEKQIPEEVFDIPQHSKGVWAPAIRYHKGEFYIYWGDPDFGVYMVKTNDINGKWSKPVLVMAGKGIIDPCPLWDGENTYLIHAWAGSRAGINSVLTINKMNAEGTMVLDEGQNVFDGHDKHHTMEGPKLYKKDGYYYIFAPAGGVETGWQVVMRSKNIYGPYEDKIVLEQGSTAVNGPHQGAWVTTQDDKSWFMHFQDQGVYGRVLHLQPMEWKEGWPVIGKDLDGNGVGEPIPSGVKPVTGNNLPIMQPVENDEFENGKPGLQWQWYANSSVKWSAQIPGTNYLRLFTISKKEEPNLWNVPNLLLQKLPAPNFTATTKVKLTTEWETSGKKTGLLLMGKSYTYAAIAFHDGKYWIQQVNCVDAIDGTPEKVIEEKPLSSNEVQLRMKITTPDANCQFSYSENGIDFVRIGKPSKAEKDLWISAKIGIFAISQPNVRMGGYADFEWFRIEK